MYIDSRQFPSQLPGCPETGLALQTSRLCKNDKWYDVPTVYWDLMHCGICRLRKKTKKQQVMVCGVVRHFHVEPSFLPPPSAAAKNPAGLLWWKVAATNKPLRFVSHSLPGSETKKPFFTLLNLQQTELRVATGWENALRNCKDVRNNVLRQSWP